MGLQEQSRTLLHSAGKLLSQISMFSPLFSTAIMSLQRERRTLNGEGNPPTETDPASQVQKPIHLTRSDPASEFWDSLSFVPLCRRALREFNKRAVCPVPRQQPAKRTVRDIQVKELQRFSRRGGPDLQRIRGVGYVFAVL
jgi:hypothetical protein